MSSIITWLRLVSLEFILKDSGSYRPTQIFYSDQEGVFAVSIDGGTYCKVQGQVMTMWRSAKAHSSIYLFLL